MTQDQLQTWGLWLAILVPMLGVVWRLATLANELKAVVEKLAKVEGQAEKIAAIGTAVALHAQTLGTYGVEIEGLRERAHRLGETIHELGLRLERLERDDATPLPRPPPGARR